MTDEPAALEAQTDIVILDPDVGEPDLSAPSMKKLLALAQSAGMEVKVHATRTRMPDVLYKTTNKAKGYTAGQVSKPAFEQENVQITVIGEKFAVDAYWHDKAFESAFIGGPASGSPMPVRVTGSTRILDEIKRYMESKK